MEESKKLLNDKEYLKQVAENLKIYQERHFYAGQPTQIVLPKGYEADRFPENLQGRVYSSILGKYVDPSNGEVIEE